VVPDQTDPRLEEAVRFAEAGRWGEAGRCFEIVAKAAETKGDVHAAQWAWTLSGDAYRKDDRPAKAALALHRAFDTLSEDGDRGAKMGAELSGVLMDSGQLDVAESIARKAVAAAESSIPAAIARDTLIGILTARGDLTKAEEELNQLHATAPPGLGIAVHFREGVHRRLTGDLSGARTNLNVVIKALRGNMPAAGAMAAATAELAEVALLDGEPDEARESFERAEGLWTIAGRRAGLFRAEAGLVRASMARGDAPIAAAIPDTISYARLRQMVLLECELRIVLGSAKALTGREGALEELDKAVNLASQAGATLLEGMARANRLRFSGDLADRDPAWLCLQHLPAWSDALDTPEFIPW